MLGSANQSKIANGGTRYTMIYRDATSLPTNTGATSYSLSNPLPAGMVARIGLRFTGATAAAYPTQSSFFDLVQGVRFTFNGDQWCNIQTQANSNANVDMSRLSAMVQDIGGAVVESTLSLTAFDATVWIPCGINVPNNSRFELALDMIASEVALTSGNFEVWVEYGSASTITFIGNQTSQNIAQDAQTLMTVKIPSVKGATVAGIMLQGATAEDNLTSVIVKPLGDWAFSPTYLRGISGASQNNYQYYGLTAGNVNTFANAVRGYYFIPLYNLTIGESGSVQLLLTAGAAQFYTATPVLNIANGGGSGERQGRQTSRVETGSKQAILQRSEEV